MTRLFVHNIAWSVTSDSLMEYLRSENFAVETVQVVIDQNTKRSKGYAFVEFTNAVSAAAARKAFDAGELHLDGRKMGANEAHPKRQQSSTIPSEPSEDESTKKRRGRRAPAEMD